MFYEYKLFHNIYFACQNTQVSTTSRRVSRVSAHSKTSGAADDVSIPIDTHC